MLQAKDHEQLCLGYSEAMGLLAKKHNKKKAESPEVALGKKLKKQASKSTRPAYDKY